MQKYVDMFTVVSSCNSVWPTFDLGNYLSNEGLHTILKGQNKPHVALHCWLCSEVLSSFF